ncbi:MAG TPA: hypothetical protein VM471_01800 [Phenylobacterium sp.]|nr:hypothetical protein [Phenylobacterium sp.]
MAEAALVAELCNLVQAHLPKKEQQLRCEVQYSELNVHSDVMGPLARMDLLISSRPTPPDDRFKPRIAIEVKRYGAPKKLIAADLQRLAALKTAKPNMRAFLVVVAEASLPKEFVNTDGEAISKYVAIPDTELFHKVRRVLKASPTFRKEQIGVAQYVCLIEVLPKPPKSVRPKTQTAPPSPQKPVKKTMPR